MAGHMSGDCREDIPTNVLSLENSFSYKRREKRIKRRVKKIK
jgi:hypothetical protein